MKEIISILGKTNVGKSSLFNKIIEKKYSTTSKKKNTTIRLIKGLSSKHLLIDTPGAIIKKSKKIYNTTNKVIYLALKKSTILLVVINKKLSANDFFILELIKRSKKRKILIINKSDNIIKKSSLLPLIKNMSSYTKFDDIIPLSTKKNTNIKYLTNILFKIPVKFKPKNIKKELSFIIKDIARKELINEYKKEIPYDTQITIELDTTHEHIIALILFKTKKKNHKSILIGHKGNKIKNIKKNIKKDIRKITKKNIDINIIIQ